MTDLLHKDAHVLAALIAAGQISAADLPASQLSMHLEQTLASEVFDGKQSHGITVRVTSNVGRTVSVTDKIGKRYKRDEAAQELPYRQKNIFAFYTCPDGSQIAFFSLMAQEYGADCPAPNTNCGMSAMYRIESRYRG